MKLIRNIVLAVSLSLAVATPMVVLNPAPAEAIILKDVYNRTSKGVLVYTTGQARQTIPAYGASTYEVARIVVPAKWALTVRITNKATGAQQDRTVYGGTGGGSSIYLGTHDSVEVLASWVYM